MNKAQLVEAIAAKTATKKEAQEIVELVWDSIKRTIWLLCGSGWKAIRYYSLIWCVITFSSLLLSGIIVMFTSVFTWSFYSFIPAPVAYLLIETVIKPLVWAFVFVLYLNLYIKRDGVKSVFYA